MLRVSSIVNEGIEGKFLFFIELLGFLSLEIRQVISMSRAWHVADLGKLADSLEFLSEHLVISSEQIVLTGPDNGWRVHL